MRVIVSNIYYHNPNCSKSREGLRILEAKNQSFDVKHYLEEPLSKDEVYELFELYNGNFKDLIRAMKSDNMQSKVSQRRIDATKLQLQLVLMSIC